MNYYTFEHRTAEGHQATVHVGSCESCENGSSKLSPSSPANGKWHGPYRSLSAAKSVLPQVVAEVHVCAQLRADPLQQAEVNAVQCMESDADEAPRSNETLATLMRVIESTDFAADLRRGALSHLAQPDRPAHSELLKSVAVNPVAAVPVVTPLPAAPRQPAESFAGHHMEPGPGVAPRNNETLATLLRAIESTDFAEDLRRLPPRIAEPAPHFAPPAPPIAHPAPHVEPPAQHMESPVVQMEPSAPQMEPPVLHIEQPALHPEQPAPPIAQSTPNTAPPAPPIAHPAPHMEPSVPPIEPTAPQMERPVLHMEQPALHLEQPAPPIAHLASHMEPPAAHIEPPVLHIEPPAPPLAQPTPYTALPDRPVPSEPRERIAAVPAIIPAPSESPENIAAASAATAYAPLPVATPTSTEPRQVTESPAVQQLPPLEDPPAQASVPQADSTPIEKADIGRSSSLAPVVGGVRSTVPKKGWFRKAIPRDARRSQRLVKPPLVAYYWTGGAPSPHPIADISSSGLYIVTDDHWYPGSIVSMTLQRTDQLRGAPESWIAVNVLVVRRTGDGLGGAFVTSTSHRAQAATGGPPNCADTKTLERFVKHLTAPAQV